MHSSVPFTLEDLSRTCVLVAFLKSILSRTSSELHDETEELKARLRAFEARF